MQYLPLSCLQKNSPTERVAFMSSEIISDDANMPRYKDYFENTW